MGVLFLQEIVTALNSGKNIVPVTDHFEWPDPETLPKDMRAVLKFNGIMYVKAICAIGFLGTWGEQLA